VFGEPIVIPADWNRHGRGAGYIRNKEMAEIGDGLLAFWDEESCGTQDMIKQAKIKKYEQIWVVTYSNPKIVCQPRRIILETDRRKRFVDPEDAGPTEKVMPYVIIDTEHPFYPRGIHAANRMDFLKGYRKYLNGIVSGNPDMIKKAASLYGFDLVLPSDMMFCGNTLLSLVRWARAELFRMGMGGVNIHSLYCHDWQIESDSDNACDICGVMFRFRES
jgi:hypothetical protein